MCLYKTHWLPKISRKPIQVYKVLKRSHGRLVTPYQEQSCKIGETIKAKNSWLKGILTNVIGEEGVHAYGDKESVENFIDCYLTFYRKLYVHICEIPPYTPYWIGKFGDIAASKMIIKEKL